MFHQASFSFPPKTEIMSIGTGNTIVEFFSGGNIVAEEVKISKKKIFLQNRSKYHDYHLAVMVGRLGLVMKRPTQTIYNWM